MAPRKKSPPKEITLNPEQQIACNAGTGVWQVAAGAGSGKCLGRGTPVIRFDGSIVPVETIQSGDLLLSPDGTPRKVLGTTQGEDVLYKITPTKGDTWICNQDHILSLKISGKHKQRTYGEYHELAVVDFLRKPEQFIAKAKLWRPEAIELRGTEVDVDPYFIGVWLGDGTSNLANIGVTKPDQEIIDCVDSLAAEWGLSRRSWAYSGARCPTHFITAGSHKGKPRGNRNPLLTVLRRLFPDGKRIPKMYLMNTIDVRRQVLAGLLDTDGYYHCGYYEICAKSPLLAEDILFCARSLGLAAYRSIKTVNGIPYSRITISGHLDTLPLRIPRKQAESRRQIKNVLRTGIKVEEIGRGDYYGFELDGDGLFLLGDFTVTHNTSVLCARYRRLLNEGVSPDQILALTFTSNAARNMRDRVGDVQKTDSRVNGFVTFHSLCLSICVAERTQFGFRLADFPLATEPQANKLMSDITKRYELNFKRAQSWISLQKRNGVRPAEAIKTAEKEGRDEKLALAYKAYDQRLRDAFVLDFDSMMLEVITMLRTKPEVRARYQYEYLMIDEAQDCCRQDYELIRLLSSSGNIFLVGDFGQGIYSFRGADPTLFRNLPDLFPNVNTLFMGKNHRSTQALVAFLKDIGPFPELAERFHTDNELGVPPQITQYPSPADEAQSVVRYAEANPKATIAVLARTNSALRPIEDALSLGGIKYRLLSNSGFWQQQEVKAVVGYVQSVLFPSDYALGNILRSGFHPTKYLKRKEIQDHIKSVQKMDGEKSAWAILNEYRPSDPNQVKAVGTLISFIHSLRRFKDLRPQAAVQQVTQALHAYDAVEEDGIDNSPTENLQELVKMSARFPTIKDFITFTFKASAASKSKTGVTLSTVHGAKGLEWPVVFLVSVCDGVLPHSKADSLEDERNIWFVGCSRAEKELHISYSGIPSQFVKPFIKTEEQQLDEVFA